MADSNITKRALATALQELMEEVPFDKIQVAHICERCDMNRKSFYYHFKDKYDLVNWIFDTDFITIAMDAASVDSGVDRWALIERTCAYFYENRDFYRKALQIRGQNSFFDHLQEYFQPLMKSRITSMIDADAADDFAVGLYTDAVICMTGRWLMDKNCIPPDQFVAKLKRLVQGRADAIYRETQNMM